MCQSFYSVSDLQFYCTLYSEKLNKFAMESDCTRFSNARKSIHGVNEASTPNRNHKVECYVDTSFLREPPRFVLRTDHNSYKS